MSRTRNSGLPVSQQGFLILSSLAAGPKHGYAIGCDVRELTDGRVRLSAATLYENLAGLVRSGFVERAGEEAMERGERRKVYRITGKGAGALSEQWQLLQRAGALIPQPNWALGGA